MLKSLAHFCLLLLLSSRFRGTATLFDEEGTHIFFNPEEDTVKRRTSSMRRLSVATLIATAVLSGSLTPAVATAATYYVAKTGSDSKSCTSAQSTSSPKRTIRSGISCLKAGDTLYVRAGTYAEPISSSAITLPTGTSWSNAPRIAAYSGEKVTLTRGSSARVLNLQSSYVKYIVFDGFVLDATGAENGIKIQAGAHHVRIQNCEVKNSVGHGIRITGGTQTHHNEIRRCDVHGHGKDLHYDHGIYIAASDNLVEDCTVHHNLAYGVHVYDGSASTAHRNIIRRVKAYSNGTVGILIGSGTGNLAYNNLVYANKTGIMVGFNATDNKLYNNTIYKNAGDGLQIRSSSSGARARNNISYSNTVNINNKGSNTTLSNNLTTDPLFVNAAGSDFHLKSGSAAINKGITLSEVLDDYEGTPRPAGASYDIGADEYILSSLSAPTSLSLEVQYP